MLGIFGSIFSTRNEFDEKPKNFNGSITIEIPDHLTLDQKNAIIRSANESLYLASMSPRERLDYYDKKSGFRT